MHELGVLCQVVKTVENICIEQNLSKVDKITLQVGELSGMVPHYIEECFPAAVYKTSLEGTKLEMEVVEGTVRCNDCGREFNAMKYNLVCPDCKSENLIPLTGREFIIKEILAC